MEKVETENYCTSIKYKYFIAGGGLYFAYKRDRREMSKHSKHENVVNKKLDSFD